MPGCAAMTSPAGWKCATALRLCRKSVHTGKSILTSQKFRTLTIAANVATRTDRSPGPVAAVIALRAWSRNSQAPASRSLIAYGRLQCVGKVSKVCLFLVPFARIHADVGYPPLVCSLHFIHRLPPNYRAQYLRSEDFLR